ncbi:histone deacetylase [Saccharothrix sp. ST-888]|uniref:histone deacetylase n=1 Tax=Saccharothrix sp. ST-888 TaxID=1427391 RepID=UPI000A6E1C95|nr:histone deacetylase [Saccharothrix sp. ST-888]
MPSPRDPVRPEPLTAGTVHPHPERVWYAAYGSNMHLARLAYYLTGGCPPGTTRIYPGCRDRSGPERATPILLRGELYFALESRTWTGGMGFFDPLRGGEMPARAYLLTVSQFSDIVAQEMRRSPGTDLELSGALTDGHAELGPGRYEILVCPGALDGYPILTCTVSWRRARAKLNRPSAAYLRHLAAGLTEAHGWDLARIADYLSTRPGAAGSWSAAEIAALCEI